MKLKNATATMLTILNLNLGGGDTLKYSSDRLILPDFRVNYETNDYCSSIEPQAENVR